MFFNRCYITVLLLNGICRQTVHPGLGNFLPKSRLRTVIAKRLTLTVCVVSCPGLFVLLQLDHGDDDDNDNIYGVVMQPYCTIRVPSSS